MFDLLFFTSLLMAFFVFLTVLYSNNIKVFANLPTILLVFLVYRLIINISLYINIILNESDFINTNYLVIILKDIFSMGYVLGNTIEIFILFIITYIVFIRSSINFANIQARFMLDSLPGLSRAIDSELMNGTINKYQAKVKNEKIHFKVNLFGSFDGLAIFIRLEFIINLILFIILFFISNDTYNNDITTLIVIGYFIPTILISLSIIILINVDKEFKCK